MGINITKQESTQLFRKYDEDNDGNINKIEFQKMIEERIAKDVLIFDDVMTQLKERFKAQDYNNSGTLTFMQTRQAFIQMGINLIDDQFNALMRQADVDGNRLIDIDEFIAMMLDYSDLETEDKNAVEAIRRIRQHGKLSPKALIGAFLALPKHYIYSVIHNTIKSSFKSHGNTGGINLPGDALKLDFLR